MRADRRRLLASLLSLLLAPAGAARAREGRRMVQAPVTPPRPAFMLAESYRPGQSLAGWWVSEKYDGMRAWWDGRHLWSRGGERLAAPAWFTAGWPAQALDGELWAGRGRFEFTVSTVRRQQPEDKAWREVRFMAFDLPTHPGDFDARLAALRALLAQPAAPWLVPVPQQRAGTHAELMALLDKTVRLGGEGLVLRRGASPHHAGRSTDLLKLKPHEEAEAVVLAHLPGRGKHAGRLGALLVRTPEGRSFRLGTGLSDAQRQAPPAIGSTVTYRHDGLHASGLPRFARFVRVREDF